jgi:hypothetical protein
MWFVTYSFLCGIFQLWLDVVLYENQLFCCFSPMSPIGYKSVFIRFMSFFDDQNYEIETEFSAAHLCRITANDICRYFNLLSYGKEEPAENDKPTKARGNTLYYHKKVKEVPRKKKGSSY